MSSIDVEATRPIPLKDKLLGGPLTLENHNENPKTDDESEAKEFKLFEERMNALSQRKLGFPTSLLGSNSSFVHYELLGIRPGSLASILINHAGDPFTESDTYQMELKIQEVMLINTIAKYFGLPDGIGRGYVTSGGTESNEACLRWAKYYLAQKASDTLANFSDKKHSLISEIQKSEEDLIKINFSDKIQEKESASAKASADREQEIQLLRKLLQMHKDLEDTHNIIEQLTKPTLFCTEKHTHYSIAKISDSLNFKLIEIKANENGSMNLQDFEQVLKTHMTKHPYNTIILSTNAGTTFLGAIDNVPKIKEILENTVPKPIYSIHMDGALNGFVMPIIRPFGEIKSYFDYTNTLSISFHKYLGLPQPTGLALTTKGYLDVVCQKNKRIIEYAGNIRDITVSGSRSGFNVLLVYNAVMYALKLGENQNKIKELVQSDLKRALYFRDKLADILGPEKVFYQPNQFNIVIPRPSLKLIQKYQLMTMKDKSVICVLHNVNFDLIEQFINDLKLEVKEK